VRVALLAIAATALGACGSDKSPPPAPTPTPTPTQAPAPPPMDRDALLAGKFPEGAPEMDVVMVRCRICHAPEYLTQQRLTEAAWKKTIDKMRKFGAVIDDADAARLVKFAAYYWNPDLPGRTWTPGPAPTGALPME